jgi:arylsulfatase A-like enzyme
VYINWYLLGKRVLDGLLAPDRDKGGALIVQGVRRWYTQRDGVRPFLLFVNLMEAHSPYQAIPRAFRRRFSAPTLSFRALESIGIRAQLASDDGEPMHPEDHAPALDLYDGAIAAADSYLGKLLGLVGEDCVVVVVSDHGELFGEHRSLYGHGMTLLEPLVRIPMVMAGGPLPRGRVIGKGSSLVDVMPTLLALAGVAAPPGLDGRDLSALLDPAGPPGARTIQIEQFTPTILAGKWPRNRSPEDLQYLFSRKQALVRGDAKRVVSAAGSDLGFDLAMDPAESRPFAGATLDLPARLPDPGAHSSPVTLDEDQVQALKALGYLR